MQTCSTVGAGVRSCSYATSDMNRIREYREAAGLTQEQLAELADTSANHVWRLENGKSKLTHEWMVRFAEALKVRPADLISNMVAAEVAPDVAPVDGKDPIVSAIAQRGLHVYRVVGPSMTKVGIKEGDVITVDESPSAVAKMVALDVVLVEIGPDRSKVLRQFLPPDSLTTNRGGANLIIGLDDKTVEPAIVGVVIRGGMSLTSDESAVSQAQS